MNIAVNTRLLRKNKLDGIGWFTFETLSRITRNHPEHQFHFIYDHQPDQEFLFSPNIVPHVILPPAKHPMLYLAWFEISIPLLLNKIKPDLFLSTDGYLSLSTSYPSLAVIHDLNFEHHPEYLPYLVQKYYRTFFPRFAAKAKRIATVSEFSKADISRLYHIDSQLIDVVYNGANEEFRPLNAEAIKRTKSKYSSGNPFIVMIGSLHPRKNIANQFLAFDLFKKNMNMPYKLIVAGDKMWWTSEIQNAFEQMQFQNDVVFTGRLNLNELHHILGSADALSYVSFFEGFGIPILEAFKCGTPVITSTTTSMPEVAGDAALFAEPQNIQAISNAYLQLYRNHELKTQLIEKGHQRELMFSWNKTSEKLWDSIQKVFVSQ